MTTMTKTHSGGAPESYRGVAGECFGAFEKRKVKTIQRYCTTVLGVIFFLVLLSCALPEESTGPFSF